MAELELTLRWPDYKLVTLSSRSLRSAACIAPSHGGLHVIPFGCWGCFGIRWWWCFEPALALPLSSLCLQAFDVVERSFLESIDDALAEKASLQSQLPEVTSQPAPGEKHLKASFSRSKDSFAIPSSGH